MRLYSYWRSTPSYRVRIALNLKGLKYETVPVDLVKGAQHEPEFRGISPIGGVPALEVGPGQVLTQSMAILEWLDETYPDPALLPSEALERARIKAAALLIACDIHPVNNLKVVNKIKAMGHSQDEATAWMNDWMAQGFQAYQALLPADTAFSFGDTPSIADLCLVPQLYNAHRWGCDLAPFKRLTEIEARCLALDAFAAARPEVQPDAT